MRNIITATLAIVAVAAGACGSTDEAGSIDAKSAELDQTVLETARATCAPGSNSITVGDDGHTLLIDHRGEDETVGASIDDVVCVLAALDVSDSIVAQMDSTRALDGTRSGSWDGYTATWSYHPDSGMSIIIEEG